jgi:RHH-type proline utilization regulon transcriptional repressor/proline dehydrogenase/delta 1-pyrroline-5-carboxylate dehydrogenase
VTAVAARLESGETAFDRALERDVRAFAQRLADLGQGERSKVFRMSWWSERMLDWAMSRPAFKTQLFRFVDVFPALDGNDDVARHLGEYFDGVEVPRLIDVGVDVADHVPFGKAVEARVARRNIARMAEQFIVGQTADEAVAGLHQLWRSGSTFTVDLLGEKTVVAAEADRYAARVVELVDALADASASWAPDDHLERDDIGPLPRVNVSIKPTALATHFEPLARERGLEQAKTRLRPLLRLAQQRNAFVHFDMEHADAKDITLELFTELLGEPEFASIEAGIVIQAYMKDSYRDLDDVITLSAARPTPITVRLVKGAYWDSETIRAQAEGWPVPVFEHKAQTDANFERCVRRLHDNHGRVRAAIGTHNLRSLAYAVEYARSLGIPDTGYEVQMLYGMAEPMHAAVKRTGLRLRVYAPVGELVPGMAYLVRRLLENTSNESFVRHRFAEGRTLDELLAPPAVDVVPDLEPQPVRAPTDARRPSPYAPEPVAEWRRSPVRAAFVDAVGVVGAAPTIDVPALIGDERVHTSSVIASVDPARFDRVVATSASCTARDADAAVSIAVEAAAVWRATPAAVRASVLFAAAAWLRAHRNTVGALEVFEAGKPWDQADADVCEAIDFCEYYGREMLRLDVSSAALVQSPPGERNRLRYQGKGVTAVIAPWNFPLAIPCGMTTAALVAGNPVILKPAEQTPAVAWQLVQALTESGLPRGVLQFLPGLGEDVGARLVEHPDVAAIVFTGSKAVGLQINEVAAVHRPGQRHVKRVVAEMGGKNAIVVDHDADPDQAVPAVVTSAFGFAGQKCSAASRVIVDARIYDAFVERVVGATREVVVGHPCDMATKVGPVIDADAHSRLTDAIDRSATQARVLLHRDDVPSGGWFVGPTVVAVDDPDSAAVARDELFGPVLTVLRADDFDHAIALANDTDYALTAGVFSRSPSHIDRAAAELRAGNVYVNRHITGAVVGRQPFGGYGMSGVGSKAGGPDYLLQFLDPRTITENTVRQGFAADE